MSTDDTPYLFGEVAALAAKVAKKAAKGTTLPRPKYSRATRDRGKKGNMEKALQEVDVNGIHPLAISVHQPWCHYILGGHKTLENRSWRRPQVTGWVYLHAALHPSKARYLHAAHCARMAGLDPAEISGLRLDVGGIVGAIYISKWVSAGDPEATGPWWIGPHAAVITQVKRFNPHRLLGKLGFFRVDLPLLEVI